MIRREDARPLTGAGRYAADCRRDRTLHDAPSEIEAGVPGFEITPRSPAARRPLIASDHDKWGRVLANAGIKPE